MTASSASRHPLLQRTWPLALGGLTTLAGLWLVAEVYRAGQPMWALGLLLLLGAGLWAYVLSKGIAWRYLFPGVTGMAVFVAFPLVYTAQIGFTNYSSAHLLGQAQVRSYLLDQALIDVEHPLVFSLHAQTDGLRLRLRSPEGASAPEAWVSPAFRLSDSSAAWQLGMQPLAADATDTLAPALPLREVLNHRDQLRALRISLPDGRSLKYAGVREFGPSTPVWREEADGSLVRLADQHRYAPNAATGYYEDAAGEHLTPGYKVFVGLANYQRMVADRDFRGPFLSIFVWTVVFAALTVLFSLGTGMTLAVLLNWEALRFRTLYRTLLFLPYAVPGFISILVFKGLFNQNFGEINAILDHVFGIKPAWFADPLLAKVMLVLVNTWLGYPYFLVLCTGLLKAIPADLYEASALAGASPWTNFRRITAPLVVKPLTPLMISAFAFNFNNFVLIALLTDGRPDFLNTKIPAGTTDILVSYTYRVAFMDSGQNYGLAAAISTVIFALVAIMSLANLKISAAAKK